MGEEKSRDITGITVRYSDGSTKEIKPLSALIFGIDGIRLA